MNIIISNRLTKDLFVFLSGILVLTSLIIAPFQNQFGSNGYLNGLSNIAVSLRRNDTWGAIAQDIVGFRAMIAHENAYPILAPEFIKLGLNWDDQTHSTHPPTAFLFTFPIAFLPWKYALILWEIMMLILIILSLRLYHLSWLSAIGFGMLSVLWSPAITSLQQITAIWMVGLAVAYHFQDKNPYISGLGLALATLVKLTPGALVLYFILTKKWKAVISFLLAFASAFGIVYLISPQVISQYLAVSQTEVPYWFTNPANGGVSSILFLSFGQKGYFMFATLLLVFSFLVRKIFIKPEFRSTLWFVGSFLAVAVLPIAWTPSLLPLLPVYIFIWLEKSKLASITAVLSFILPCLSPVGSFMTGWLVAATILVLAISLIFLVRAKTKLLESERQISL